MTNLSAGLEAATPRPLIQRYKPMRFALLACAISEVGLIVMGGGEYYVRNELGFDPYLDEGETGLAFGLGALAIGLLQIVSYIASIILVCMWTFRAMKNLHISRAPQVSMSPGWAVGWYFIPFANLWKPFEGMLQIWRGSMAQAGRPEKVASFVGWWWAAWLVSNFLSNISMRLSGFLEEGPAYDAGLLVGIAASVIAIPSIILLLRTTHAVTDAQQTGGRASVPDVFA